MKRHRKSGHYTYSIMFAFYLYYVRDNCTKYPSKGEKNTTVRGEEAMMRPTIVLDTPISCACQIKNDNSILIIIIQCSLLGELATLSSLNKVRGHSNIMH